MNDQRSPIVRPSRVRCEHGHVTTVDAPQIEITHTANEVVGFRFWCDECRFTADLPAPAAQIALLHEFGATVAPDLLPTAGAPDLHDDQRRIVSMRVLLDDRVLAELTEAESVVDSSPDDVPLG